jgi:tetratricopeptide (TPR) repeat protein
MDAWTARSGDYLRLAEDTGDLHQIERAESAVYHALLIDSTYTPSVNQLSKILSAQHRFEDVLYVQNWSIIQDLKNAESWGILGDAFMDLGKYRSADSCYHMMRTLDPGFHSLVRIARRTVIIGEYDEAVHHFRMGIDSAEAFGDSSGVGSNEWIRDLADAHVRLGMLYLSHGEIDSAREQAAASLGVLPGYVPAHCLEAEVLRIDRKFGASRHIYAKLIEGSTDPRLKSAFARVYADQRQPHRVKPLVRQTAEEYEALFDTFPDIVRRDYVEFLLEWNLDLERALSLAVTESKRRRDVFTYDVLAWAYYKNGKYDFAWSSIGFALRKGTRHPRILYHAAVIAKAAGKTDKHAHYSNEMQRLNPKYKQIFGSL